MAKDKKLAFRLDGDVARDLVGAATRFKQTQTNIVSAALHAFTLLPVRKQRQALVAFLTRAVPEPKDDAKGS